MSTITDMREHLMQTLASLRDRENPMDVDRARAVAQVASVLVDSAKVEVDYIKATGSTSDSLFISPLSANPDRLSDSGAGDSCVERTPTGLIHRLRGCAWTRTPSPPLQSTSIPFSQRYLKSYIG